MNKLSKLINEMEYSELVLLKKDLDEGNLSKLLTKKLEKKEEISVCPVCGMLVKRDVGFYLEFGKEFRKKAVFDELDCLKYFLDKIK